MVTSRRLPYRMALGWFCDTPSPDIAEVVSVPEVSLALRITLRRVSAR